MRLFAFLVACAVVIYISIPGLTEAGRYMRDRFRSLAYKEKKDAAETSCTDDLKK